MEFEELCQREKQQRTENGPRRVTGSPSGQKAKGCGDGLADGEWTRVGRFATGAKNLFQRKKRAALL
jgi:hypothetical protein